MTKEELVKKIRFQLGEPILTVELNDQQILYCIDDAAGYWTLLGKQTESVKEFWIERYAYCLALEMLGIVRMKYESIPLPNSQQAHINWAELFNSAASEKAKLEAFVN